MTNPEPANHKHFPALDGLRAVAFLMVFAQHYRLMPWGWAGVDVFFVLSGFLITGILFDTRDQVHRVRNFYIRRTLRIFPLYYGLMLVFAVAYPLFHWRWDWAFLLWPAYLGNFCRAVHPYVFRSPLEMLADFQLVSATHNVTLYLGHFWSLCVEEQFYLIWPWVVFWVRDRKKLLYICLACIVICPAARVIANHTLPQFMLDQEVLYRWTPFRVDALLIGGFIALVRRGTTPRWLPAAARIGFGVLLGALLLWLALNPYARHGPEGYVYPAWEFTWGLVFVDAISACLIVMALARDSITYRILNVRPLRWIGQISYGAYVFHDILHDEFSRIILLLHLRHTRVPTVALALTFTLLAAWASYHLFEMRFIALKDRWTRREPVPSLETSGGTGKRWLIDWRHFSNPQCPICGQRLGANLDCEVCYRAYTRGDF
jgi:peptidoglycan/LPS O-acetylase OafA/YrhL